MPRREVLIPFSGAMLGLLLAALDQTIVATALPRIVADLHGLNHLSWVVTAYLVTSTVAFASPRKGISGPGRSSPRGRRSRR